MTTVESFDKLRQKQISPQIPEFEKLREPVPTEIPAGSIVQDEFAELSPEQLDMAKKVDFINKMWDFSQTYKSGPSSVDLKDYSKGFEEFEPDSDVMQPMSPEMMVDLEERAGKLMDKEEYDSYIARVHLANEIDREFRDAQQKQLEKFYELHPEKKPRQYKSFFEDFGRNLVGDFLQTGAGWLHNLDQISNNTMLFMGWNPDTLNEWATDFHNKAQERSFGPSVGGGVKGYLTNLIGRNLFFMGTTMAAYFYAGPGAAALLGFSREGEEAYRNTLSAGGTEEEAVLNQVIVGTLNSALETIQFTKLSKALKIGGKGRLLRLATGKTWDKIKAVGGNFGAEHLRFMMTEGLIESMQEIPQMWAEAQRNPDVWDTLSERLGGAFLGGVVLYGTTSGAARVVNGALHIHNKNIMRRSLMEQGGLNEDLANTLIQKASEGTDIAELEKEFRIMKMTGKSIEQLGQEGISVETRGEGVISPPTPSEKTVLYHGSPEGKLTKIDPTYHTNKWREGIGFYVTENPDVAQKYAQGSTRGQKAEGAVNQVRLKTERILDFDAPARDHIEVWRKVAEDAGLLEGDMAWDEIWETAISDTSADVSNMEMYKEMAYLIRENQGGQSADAQYDIEDSLVAQGIDATTHIEGKKSGNPHRVWVIKNADVIEQVAEPTATGIDLEIQQQQEKLRQAQQPISAIQEGQKQADVEAVETERLQKEQSAKEALARLTYLEEQKVQEAQKRAEEESKRQELSKENQRVFSGLNEKLNNLLQELDELNERIPVVIEGKLQSEPSAIEALVAERNEKKTQLQEEIENTIEELEAKRDELGAEEQTENDGVIGTLNEMSDILNQAGLILPPSIVQKAPEEPKFQLPTEVNNQQTLQQFGETTLKIMGREDLLENIEFEFSKRKTKRRMGTQITYLDNNKMKIIIYPEHSEHKYKDGSINQAALQETIVHELAHIFAAIPRTESGRQILHGKDFKETMAQIQDKLDDLMKGQDEQRFIDKGADLAEFQRKQLLNQPSDEDLSIKDFENSMFDRIVEGLLKRFKVEDIELTPAHRDFNGKTVKQFLWMPDYISKQWPRFRPIYRAVRRRVVQRTNLSHFLDRLFTGYSTLTEADRKVVDQVLVDADRNPGQFPDFWDDASEQTRQKGRQFLEDMGLSETQIDGVVAWERTFKTIDKILTAKMEELGLSPEAIKEYSNRRKHFIPHRWYGNWLVHVFEETTDPQTGQTKRKTIHLYDTDTTFKRAVLSRKIQRQLARKEVQKYRKKHPEYQVELIEATDYPSESFQEAPSYVVRAMANEVLTRMELSKFDEDTRNELRSEFNAMMTHIYKEKGGGKLFLKRKNIPGYSEDLLKPAADYMNHFTGFITKLDMVNNLSKGLQQIPRKKMPKLFDYAVEYAKYNMKPVQELLGLKKYFYMMYLWGNISSAHLQLTQDFITAWPELSKYTDRSLEKMITSIGDVIYNDIGGGRITEQEQIEIERFREAGYLEPRETLELAGRVGGIFDNPRPLVGVKIQKGIKYIDIFRKMEMVNREAMALALIRSGIKVDTELDSTVEGKIRGGQLIDNAHFMYGKANRPKLMRGLTNPIMIFRSFGIHYLGWAKIQVDGIIKGDGKAAGALARSIFATWFFGGFASLLGVRFLADTWKEMFGTDFENELIKGYGEVGKVLWEGPASKIFPVDFSRRVTPYEFPTPKDFRTWRDSVQTVGGVLTDLPIRSMEVFSDLQNQDYLRLFEDLAPSAISNVVQGYRLHTRGLEKRSGEPISGIGTKHRTFQSPLKLTVPEMIFKMMGYQPQALGQQWEITENVRNARNIKLRPLRNWATRWKFALSNEKEPKRVIIKILDEMDAWNTKWDRLGKPWMKVSLTEDLFPMIDDRLEADLPTENMMEALMQERAIRFGEALTPEQRQELREKNK